MQVSLPQALCNGSINVIKFMSLIFMIDMSKDRNHTVYSTIE